MLRLVKTFGTVLFWLAVCKLLLIPIGFEQKLLAEPKKKDKSNLSSQTATLTFTKTVFRPATLLVDESLKVSILEATSQDRGPLDKALRNLNTKKSLTYSVYDKKKEEIVDRKEKRGTKDFTRALIASLNKLYEFGDISADLKMLHDARKRPFTDEDEYEDTMILPFRVEIDISGEEIKKNATITVSNNSDISISSSDKEIQRLLQAQVTKISQAKELPLDFGSYDEATDELASMTKMVKKGDKDYVHAVAQALRKIRRYGDWHFSRAD